MSGLRFHPEALDTPRLQLRPVIQADAEAMHAYQSDPESCRYLPYAPRTRAQVEAVVARFVRTADLVHAHDRLIYSVLTRDGGELIGEIHLVLRDAGVGEMEVGWVFRRSVAGRGYATEAARAVLDAAFAAGAHRIVAELDPRNAASVALCGRLGMREEARFVKNYRDTLPDGTVEWADTGIHAILAEEWRG